MDSADDRRVWSLSWRKATPYGQATDPARWEKLRNQFAAIRASLGLSLQEVENATGCRRSHIHQFETGSIVEPKFAFIYALGQVYGLTPDDIAATLGLEVTGSQATPHAKVDSRLAAMSRRLADMPDDLAEIALNMAMNSVAAVGRAAKETGQVH